MRSTSEDMQYKQVNHQVNHQVWYKGTLIRNTF